MDTTDDQLRQLVAEGLSQREIARRTGLSRATLYRRFQRLGLTPGQPAISMQPAEGPPSTVDRQPDGPAPSTVDRPPSHPPPSTTGHVPSTIDQFRTDLQATLTAALQPVLARLEALETGMVLSQTEHRPPSTVHPNTGQGPPVDRPPSTVDRQTWEMRPLKHSVRWTIYVPQALKEQIQQRAAARQQHPSVVVQELLWQALKDQSSSP